MSLREEIAAIEYNFVTKDGVPYKIMDSIAPNTIDEIVNKLLDAVIALGEDHEYDKSTYFYMEAINKLRGD